MAGSKEKKFMSAWVDEAFLARVDRAAAEYGIQSGRVCKRSDFVRAVVAWAVSECEQNAAQFAAMMKEGGE